MRQTVFCHRNLWAISLLLTSFQLPASTLKPFRTDGCSALPDGTIEQKTLWQSCCIAHDYEYWKGSTYRQRLVADKALKHCVAKKWRTYY